MPSNLELVAVVPLDASSAIEALLGGPLGTVIEFGMGMLILACLFGTIVAAAAAGISHLSQDAKRQGAATKWAIASLACLLAAGAVVAGPEVIAELGFESARHLSVLG